MAQEQQTAANWMALNVTDAVSAGAEQIKEASKASLDASLALIEIYREAASVLRDRGDHVFRTGMAIVEAGVDTNFAQISQMADMKDPQDIIRLQMMWGANQTLAVYRALSKIDGTRPGGGAKAGRAVNA